MQAVETLVNNSSGAAPLDQTPRRMSNLSEQKLLSASPDLFIACATADAAIDEALRAMHSLNHASRQLKSALIKAIGSEPRVLPGENKR